MALLANSAALAQVTNTEGAPLHPEDRIISSPAPAANPPVVTMQPLADTTGGGQTAATVSPAARQDGASDSNTGLVHTTVPATVMR